MGRMLAGSNVGFLRIAAAYPVLVARQIPPMRCASRDEIIGFVLPPKTLVIVIRAECAARDVEVRLRFDPGEDEFAASRVESQFSQRPDHGVKSIWTI